MTGRILTLLLAAAGSALALVLGPVPGGHAEAAASEVSLAPNVDSFRTTTLSPAARDRLDATSFWGGPVASSTGELVTLFFSNTYPQDAALQQQWANFFTSLLHGSELASLKAYLLPLTEVQSFCGRGALACYSADDSTLVSPATDPSTSVTAQAVATHEYGHHIAAHRSDEPWRAVDYGPKRWSSYENVCSRTQTGELHPGAEDQENYETNPGEAWAETYRVLNQRRLGLPETQWDIVSPSLYPDATALTLAQQDVLQPWASATAAATFRGTSGRTYAIPTPLDGRLTLKVSAARKTRVQLRIGSTSTTTATGGSRTVTRLVCGQRTTSVRVTRIAGKGAYTLTVAKP